MVVVLQHKKHSKLHTAKRLTKISDLLTVQLKKKASKKSTFYFRCAIDGFELEIIHQREPSNLTRKDFHKSCPLLLATPFPFTHYCIYNISMNNSSWVRSVTSSLFK